MAMSLACGERVTLSKVDAFADGVAVKQVRHSVGPHRSCSSSVVTKDYMLRTSASVHSGSHQEHVQESSGSLHAAVLGSSGVHVQSRRLLQP